MSDVDDIMDIHICGACRTEFNDMKVFLQHKKECQVLSRRKQNQVSKVTQSASDTCNTGAIQLQIESENTSTVDTGQHTVQQDVNLPPGDLSVSPGQLCDGSTGSFLFTPPPGHEYAQTPRKKVKQTRDHVTEAEENVLEVVTTDDGRIMIANKLQDKITVLPMPADQTQFQELLQTIKAQQDADKFQTLISELNVRLNQDEQTTESQQVQTVVSNDQQQVTKLQNVPRMDLDHNGTYSLLPRSQIPDSLQPVTSFHHPVSEMVNREEPCTSVLPQGSDITANNLQMLGTLSTDKLQHLQQQTVSLLNKHSLVDLTQLKQNQGREPGIEIGQENLNSDYLGHQNNINNNANDIENVMYLGLPGAQPIQGPDNGVPVTEMQYIHIQGLARNNVRDTSENGQIRGSTNLNVQQDELAESSLPQDASHYTVHLQNVSHSMDNTITSNETTMNSQNNPEQIPVAVTSDSIAVGSLEQGIPLTNEDEIQESQVVEQLNQAYLKLKTERSKAVKTSSSRRTKKSAQNPETAAATGSSDHFSSKKGDSASQPKAKSTPTKKYKCDFKENCTFTTAYLKDLERHIRTHTGEKPFQCCYCSRSFSRADKLRLHERGHTGEKPYACGLCGYRAVDSGSLKKHMAVHSNEKPFQCQMCPYACRTSSQLTVHLRTHTGDAPFTCPHCPSKFKIKSDMRRHLRIHTGDKPFKCEKCDVRCATRSNLMSHVKVHHSTDRQFKCVHCGYLTSSKRCFYEHQKQHHWTDPQCVCPYCKYICANRETLKAHIMNTHEEKVYKCTECEFSTSRKMKLKHHKQKCHLTSGLQRNPEYDKTKMKQDSKKYRGYEKLHKCDICGEAFVRKDSLNSHLRLHDERLQSKLSTALTVLELQQPVIKSGANEANGVASAAPSVDNDAIELEKVTQSDKDQSEKRIMGKRQINNSNVGQKEYRVSHDWNINTLVDVSTIRNQLNSENPQHVEKQQNRNESGTIYGSQGGTEKANIELFPADINSAMDRRNAPPFGNEHVESLNSEDPRFQEQVITEPRIILVSSNLNNSGQALEGRILGINTVPSACDIDGEQRLQDLGNQAQERLQTQGLILHNSSQSVLDNQLIQQPSDNSGTNLVIQTSDTNPTVNSVVLPLQESGRLPKDQNNISDIRLESNQNMIQQAQLPSIQLIQNFSFPVVSLPNGQLITITGVPLTGQVQGESTCSNDSLVPTVNPTVGVAGNQISEGQGDQAVQLITPANNGYLSNFHLLPSAQRSEPEVCKQTGGWSSASQGSTVLSYNLINTQSSGDRNNVEHEKCVDLLSSNRNNVKTNTTTSVNCVPLAPSQQVMLASSTVSSANQNSMLLQSDSQAKTQLTLTSQDKNSQMQIDVQSIEMDANISNYDVVFQNEKFIHTQLEKKQI